MTKKAASNKSVQIRNMSGGMNINADKMTVKGDAFTGEKITNIANTGMSADDVAKLFNSIYQKIGQKPKEDQADIRDAVDVIKTAAKDEAVEGKKPDESAVKMASNSLAMTAPDILKDVADVALATFSSPAAGVATIIQKVLAKIKQ